MSGKHSQATKIVTTFGAGLACAALAPSAEAAIISLTPTPGSVGYNPGPFTYTVNVNLAPGVNFGQYNDFIGKSMVNNGGGVLGFVFAPQSNMITASMNFTNLLIGTGASGTATVGFQTSGGNLGWLRLNFGGSGGTVTYLAGALNTDPRAPIHSGSVPEPATLGLLGLSALAAGARGIKRLRERHHA